MLRHWHVLGAGAIGCLFAAALQRAGTEPTLVLRTSTRRVPGTRGDLPSLVVAGRTIHRSRIQTTVGSDDAGKIDHLLLTTKAYDASAALSGVAHRLSADCQVLLMINGMGLLEDLAEEHPRLSFYLGTTTEGAWSVAPLHVHHAGRGETHIGRVGGGAAPAWIEDWSRALPDCGWDPEIELALWRKLAINCAINPLTAIHGCRNGELAAQRGLAARTAAVCDEIAAICEAAGFAAIADSLAQSVAAVIAGTATNHSSMLQDIRAGRRTEIDYITGYLLAVAERCGVPAPRNRELLAAVRALERRSGT